MLASISTGSLPIWSAMIPSPSVPKRQPTKNKDWPRAGFQSSSHTQSNCEETLHDEAYMLRLHLLRMSPVPILVLAWMFIVGLLAHPLPDIEDAGDVDENLLEGYFPELGEVIYGQPMNETGEKVAQWRPDMGVNPEELGEYLEGDILFPESLSRNGLRAERSRWPGGVVYYTLSPYFTDKDRGVISSAIQEYHTHTCIKFVPWSGVERDYIRFLSGSTGCWSSVGRTGGSQELNLQSPGCLTKRGTAMHEIMHALGFYHEHTRWERDNHVTVHYENIQRGRENNFQKSSKQTTDALGVNYDYGSVMHYSDHAFSSNNKPTIEPKVKGVYVGQRDGFSKGDIKKINRMYKCKNHNAKMEVP